MAKVSISEAAKLTGKSRMTIQRYVATGRLSLSRSDTNKKEIDISEIIRVFGEIRNESVTKDDASNEVTMSHDVITKSDKNNIENETLKKEIEYLKQRIQDKDAHIDSLKNALLLIESKLPIPHEQVIQTKTKKSWQFWKK